MSDRETLKQQADAMGLKYPGNISNENLSKLIEEAAGDNGDTKEIVAPPPPQDDDKSKAGGKAKSKAKEPKTSTYTALCNIRLGGKRTLAGKTIELTKEEATELKAAKAI